MPTTRSSANRNSVPAKMSSTASVDTRKALGDASNRRLQTRTVTTEKPAAENKTLRRSRRLCKDPADDSVVAGKDKGTVVRKPTLRSTSSLKVHVNGQATSNRTTRQIQSKETLIERDVKPKRGASTRKKADAENAPPKRARANQKEDSERPRKAMRTVSREKQISIESNQELLSIPTDFKTRNLSSDILEYTDYGLQRYPFDASKYTAGISPYDKDSQNDAQEVASYTTDLFQRLFHTEGKTLPSLYMEIQPELNSMMRSILVDWIVEVHMKFRLLPETLHLCVNIIDRFLSRIQVPRRKLQLVGVTSLLIACKYEEIYPPEVKDCVYITDRAYTRQEVLDMEANIVRTLKFRMTVPTGYPFLQRFLHVSKATRTMKNLANFYMERMLQEYNTLNYRPSLVAAAAVSLAMNNPDVLEYEGYPSDYQNRVPSDLLAYSGFLAKDIKVVARLIETRVGETETTHSRRSLIAVKRKYESDRYDNVSSNSFELPKVSHLGPM